LKIIATSERKPLLADDMRPDIHAYLGGVPRSGM
jgi:hypothetical protein